jgi:hypothetical protein
LKLHAIVLPFSARIVAKRFESSNAAFGLR